MREGGREERRDEGKMEMSVLAMDKRKKGTSQRQTKRENFDQCIYRLSTSFATPLHTHT